MTALYQHCVHKCVPDQTEGPLTQLMSSAEEKKREKPRKQAEWITTLSDLGLFCFVCVHRVQQLEDENGEMKLNVCRLKSQTEKLDQVSLIC